MKRLLVLIFAIAFFFVLCFGIVHTDWFRRNYAYYGDCIHIYLYEDGRLLETEEYDISMVEWWHHEELGNSFTENRLDYSLQGDYGTFYFILKYQGREAQFFLENVNDWWRTNINLHIDTYSDTIRQTNIVWNNDPAFADSFILEWEEAV